MSVVTTVAGLKVISSPLANETYETTDFGTGLWYYDSTGSPSEDNTGTVIARTGGGVFRRIYPGKTVYASWFGAIGDGATDDYDALQDAIDYLAGSGSLILEKGTYFLNKSLAGALQLPTNAAGITIQGEDECSTIIKLSKNVPRAFDLAGNNSTTSLNVYENIVLENFTVDANNIDGAAMGAPITATANGTGPVGATDVTVASTSGLLTKGVMYIAALGVNRAYMVTSSTVVQLYLSGSETISMGDVLQPAILSHVIVGDDMNMGSNGIYGYNVAVNNLTVRNVNAINIPAQQATTTFGAVDTIRTGIVMFTAEAPGYSGPKGYLTNITISNVKVNGGNKGIGVFSSPLNGAYLDNILIENCYHSTGIIPTIQYDGYNYLIGNKGYGGKAIIRNCYGSGAGDVGIETDALTNVTVLDCVIENCFSCGYYSTNFVAPADDINGAPTTTLSGGISSGTGAGTIAVSAIPSGIANEGYLSIDSELMYYKLRYSSTTIDVFRGLNNTAGVAHSNLAVVIFAGLEKQKLTYERCVYRNTQANDSIAANLGHGWFQQRSTIYPNPATAFRDCVYERAGTALSTTGEAIFITGANSIIDINGFKATINGIDKTTGSSIGASAIQVINNDYGAFGSTNPIRPEVLLYKNIDIEVSGTLDSGMSNNNVYFGIYFTYGNYYLDWSDLRLSMNFLNTRKEQTFGLHFGYVNNYVSGKIDTYKLATSGDISPYGIYSYTANNIGELYLSNLDYTDMYYDNSSTLNYRPYVVLATNQTIVSVQNIKHSTSGTTKLTNEPQRRVALAANTSSYTTKLTEDYLAINNTTTTCAITLARAATILGGSLHPNYGVELLVADEAGTAATYNITLTPSSGELINGSATPYVINTNYGFVKLKAVPWGYIRIS